MESFTCQGWRFRSSSTLRWTLAAVLLLGLSASSSLSYAAPIASPSPSPFEEDLRQLEVHRREWAETVSKIKEYEKNPGIERIREKLQLVLQSPVIADGLQKILDRKNYKTFFVTQVCFIVLFLLFRLGVLTGINGRWKRFFVGLFLAAFFWLTTLFLLPMFFFGGGYLQIWVELYGILKL